MSTSDWLKRRFAVKHLMAFINIDSPLHTNSLVFQSYPFLNYYLVGQIYCTFPMGKPVVVCNNVLTVNEWFSVMNDDILCFITEGSIVATFDQILLINFGQFWVASPAGSWYCVNVMN